jgi:hypothetical protein
MSVSFQTQPEKDEDALKRFFFMQLHSISSTVSSSPSSPLLQALGLVQHSRLFDDGDFCSLTFKRFGIVETKHPPKKHHSLRAKDKHKGKGKGQTATHH